MGYVDAFIADDSLPETKTLSVRLSLNRKTLKNLEAVKIDGGYATYSMTVARLIDAKAGRIKAREKSAEAQSERRVSKMKPSLTLEIPDYVF